MRCFNRHRSVVQDDALTNVDCFYLGRFISCPRIVHSLCQSLLLSPARCHTSNTEVSFTFAFASTGFSCSCTSLSSARTSRFVLALGDGPFIHPPLLRPRSLRPEVYMFCSTLAVHTHFASSCLHCCRRRWRRSLIVRRLYRRSSFPFDRLPAKRYDCDHSLSLAPACARPSDALVFLLYTSLSTSSPLS